MKYKLLGQTGIKVSQLCLGTMSFGGDADASESERMFELSRDTGINFFDCADVYNDGEAERILGRLVKKCRDEVVIASKVYFPTGEGINSRGASRYHIMNAVESSLKRLQTDRIDVYYIHRFDDLTPIDETLKVLDDLVAQGKVLYPGASNFAAWQVAKALGISERRELTPFYCVQPMYNLVKRQAEVEIFPQANAENLGVVPYSPLGGGLLTGKYNQKDKPDKARLTHNKMYATRYGHDWMFQTAKKFSEFAAKRGFSPVSLAVAWAASHPAVTCPIIGARNVAQLKDSINSVQIEMTDEMRERISSLSPEPSPATDRNEERTEHNYGIRK
ncbi:MAG: aldo/keto reductase [Candidatus Aminicenantes bacterium]|nr:aldo/keto reductase [Candidatus Aminicenantes bacterium]